ncbi:CDP-diacylglycerol--serine O-phosphatidyltransferase [Alistipes sp.]|uniref:CDP-diacylglycerol--serine O-phosphatidyltransferase n=1 Tax=Alistipes sp. TaxID=1872444 RepID=UPI003AF18565
MKIKLFTIPNLLTLANLLCGSFAAVCALVYGNLTAAFWLVVLAAVFDFLDGFAARLLKCPSPIGLQLDSLADVISFGFVPAAVLYVMTSPLADAEVWVRYAITLVCFAMTAFSALRLAKFNIDETQHTEFCGLPTPANALFFTSLGLICARTGFDSHHLLLLLFLAPVMSWMLVSPVRMFALKFQGFGWRGNEVRYGFLAGCVVLIAALRLYSIPAIIVVYILISVVRWIARCAKGCDLNN